MRIPWLVAVVVGTFVYAYTEAERWLSWMVDAGFPVDMDALIAHIEAVAELD